MKKTVFALLLIALIAIPLVSAQTLPEAGAPIAAGQPLSDPGMLTEPLTVSLGNGRFAAYIPVANLDTSQDFTARGDTWAEGISPNTTHGGDPLLEIGIYKGEPDRIYVAFDCGAIPSSATVTFARFSIYLVQWRAGSSVPSEMRRVTSYWSSSSLTWNNKPNSNYYSTRTIDLTPGYKDYTCTSLVETYWKANDYGVGGNLGLELRGNESTTSDYHLMFNSREASSNKPWLYVEYSDPDVTPSITPTLRPTPTPTREPGIGVSVEKVMLEPDNNPVVLGDVAECLITVRNTGDTTLTHITLVDDYPVPCFEFVDANPMPDTVDPATGMLTWNNLCTLFGANLPPGGHFDVYVNIRAVHVCPTIFYNCARVQTAIDDQRNQADTPWTCIELWTEPLPPDIELVKVFPDPEVCVGDEAWAFVAISNTGGVPIERLAMTDTYDTDYLATLLPAWEVGPDDGELQWDLNMMPGMPPGLAILTALPFLAEAETPLTTDVFEAVANDYPPSHSTSSAGLTILPEAGPCEGNLVLNPGFEDGITHWQTWSGILGITGHSHTGANALRLGILPGEQDALRVDNAGQYFVLPADAHGAHLSFFYYVGTTDPCLWCNSFTAVVANINTMTSSVVVPEILDTGGMWLQAHFDLTPWIGDTIAIAFFAKNDGEKFGPLYAYVDDVEVCISRCGPPVDIPDPGDGICWKATYPDYAPNGMPDFDMNEWEHGQPPYPPYMDGPAAVANCLWWYDSKFEPGDTPPPAISDGYPLVEAYDASWDDHAAENVVPFVGDLAARMETDGAPAAPGSRKGTTPGDMKDGIQEYLVTKQLETDYAVEVVKAPAYDVVRDHIVRCDDVMMLLGFWEMQPDGWRRLGGHWVNGAGVDCVYGQEIAISDPEIDSAEMGYPGQYWPLAGHTAPHATNLHFDAAYVSHDIYTVWQKPVPDAHARFGLNGYVRWDDVLDQWYPQFEYFYEANIPEDLEPLSGSEHQGGQIETRVEYAVIVSPVPETVTMELRPAGVSTPEDQIFEVDLWVTGRHQTYESVDAYLDFDPAYLQCVGPDGSPISEIPAEDLTMVNANDVDNGAGEINLSMRVPLGDPALNGPHLVAKLYFVAVEGTPPEGTRISYSYSEPRRSNVLMGATSVLGMATGSTVQTVPSARLNVEVQLQGRERHPDISWVGPVELSLLDPTTLAPVAVYAATTDQYGRFTLEGVPTGAYVARVKGIHTIANRTASMTFGAGEWDVYAGELHEGDVDNDNDVDAADASLLNAAFGSMSGAGNWDPRADLNEDGVVNSEDMNLLGASFGEVGDLTVDVSAAALESKGMGLALNGTRPAAGGDIEITNGSTITDTLGAGEILPVDIMVNAGSDRFDTVDVHISYPKDVVAIVDAAGNPVTSINCLGGWSLVLRNEVDAANGWIHFAATQTGSSKTGDIAVARYYVKGIRPGVARMRFGVWPPDKTSVQYLGQDMLSSWPATTYYVRGAEGLYIPLIARD